VIKRVGITVRYNIIGYLIGEGLKNVFKNKKSTVAAIGIMCATMIIFGGFFAISENISNMLTELERSQGIEVFIKNEATEAQTKEIGEKIRALNGVNTAKFVSYEEAVTRFKDQLENREELLESLEGVLPRSYIVTFTDLELSYDIQTEINSWDNIKKITSNNETTSTLMNLGHGIRVVSAVILIFLIIVSLFIISNTIKLTVHARRKEISIMKYVGATNSFIRWPFVVEGIIIGLISAIISLIVVGGGYNIFAEKLMSSALIEKLGVVLVNFNDMLSIIVIVYLILGMGSGIVGSSISMKKYLEV